jgi:hypothetical protein
MFSRETFAYKGFYLMIVEQSDKRGVTTMLHSSNTDDNKRRNPTAELSGFETNFA